MPLEYLAQKKNANNKKKNTLVRVLTFFFIAELFYFIERKKECKSVKDIEEKHQSNNDRL